ncbi:MAG: tRNA (adenosine(37)-N6)-threonylcarbamoyltransferase complex dimerization subunit type 1 TsaB [Bacteroidia bacterium]
MSADSLDAIAVGKGPGSYTGLRVGVSTAKGLCMALHKPLLAFGSLEALAWQVRDLAQHLKADICPLIDARRMEVYCARYDASGRELNPPQAEILSPDAFVAWQSERRLLLPGDGAAKAASLFADTDQVWVMPEIQASAAYLGPRLMAAWQAGETEDLVSFEPYYLKDFVATRPRSLLQQIGRPDGTTPGD